MSAWSPAEPPLPSLAVMKAYLERPQSRVRMLAWRQRKQWSEAALPHVRYELLSREDRGIVRRYLQQATGYSRASVARCVARYCARHRCPLCHRV